MAEPTVTIKTSYFGQLIIVETKAQKLIKSGKIYRASSQINVSKISFNRLKKALKELEATDAHKS